MKNVEFFFSFPAQHDRFFPSNAVCFCITERGNCYAFTFSTTTIPSIGVLEGASCPKRKVGGDSIFYGYHSSALVEQSMELKHGDQIWMISDGVFQETIELDVQEQQYMAWWTEESPTAAEFMEWKTRFFWNGDG